MSMQSAVDQVVFSKSSTKKTTSETKEPKVAPIVNFMNGAITRATRNTSAPANTLLNNSKKVVFKEYGKLKDASKIKKSLVIDLDMYDGLNEIRTAYAVAANANADAETDEEKVYATGITKGVYEPIARGYLSMSETRFVEKKKRAKKSEETETEGETDDEVIQTEHLQRAIGSLKLPPAREYSILDFIEAIRTVVEDSENFKVKAFNKSFPLSVHNTEKTSTHVNNKYVQHWLPHGDILLQHVVGE